MSRVSDDVDSLQYLYSQSLSQIVRNIFYLFFGITILFTLSVKLSLISISIKDSIKKLIWNRTTFIIAHRLSLIDIAHKILVLDTGRIVETGKYDELTQIIHS